jgi:hypothetical protein
MQEFRHLSVTKGDGAGLIEQKHVHIPAVSTARPDTATTFFRIIRPMPAMPMAESSAPMVVGIRQTSSATSTVRVIGCPALHRGYALDYLPVGGDGIARLDQQS